VEQATQTCNTLPRLGEPAPQFEADTTHGPMKLEDYKGRWVILFSHPADFTPVCTTEFMAFSDIYDDLKQRGVELLGLSVDSNSSHIAWVRNIEERTGKKIQFPVIADLSKEIATKYGMIHPANNKTATARCVFFIDPKQVIRAMIYYPATTGRNMDEIIRVIDCLQTTDANQVATPANWRPGDKVVVPAPVTQAGAEDRVKQEGLECVDWYLCKKNV
jgi:peroxiredoxin 2/4